MEVDKYRLKEFINTLFPTHRVEVTEFDSGAFVIDIFRLKDFITIQYGLNYIGVSVVPNDDPAAGFGLSDEIFYTINDFEDYVEKTYK
ncbi:hypothetical protein [Chitinophaga sp. 212800010-3]|uniref:hypothetical protein n=1 Tax=unclassified Chitinophaga TaxID=2619133 RepID=UPI002DF64346|nr:Cytosolic protein [Chitinophaga sp. 212800010-3]